MPLVLLEHIAVCLDARNARTAVVAVSRDPEGLSTVLVDPLKVRPARRIGFVWRDEVEVLRIDSCWMAERQDVTLTLRAAATSEEKTPTGVVGDAMYPNMRAWLFRRLW